MASHRAISRPFSVALVIIALGVAAYLSLGWYQSEFAPARLSLGGGTVYCTGGQSVNSSETVTNFGGRATQVVFLLSSSAISPAINYPPVTIPSGFHQVDVPVRIRCNDVANGWYPVEAALSYQDSEGTHTFSGPCDAPPCQVFTGSAFVIPNLEVTGLEWQSGGLVHPGWNVTIGPNGSALAYFSVHSKSSSAYYGNLSLQLVGLSIGGTPFSSKLLISPITPFNLTQIGPNQTSVEYALSIESNLAAPSTYLFEIWVSTHHVLAVQQELAVTVTL